MAFITPNLNVMINAVRKASKGLLRDFGEIEKLQVSLKGTNDFVSTADLKCEKALKAELSKARPSYGFLMEESKEEIGSEPDMRWIVDPLDGTTNFLHGIPHFAISVALAKGNEIIDAVIFNPVLDELYFAEKGNGAYLANARNDERLRVSSRRDIKSSLIATGIPFLGHGDHEFFLKQLTKVMGNTAGVRRFGAASLDLAWVAAGRYDGFWEMGLKSWDVAAGLLIVKEAGGMVTESTAADIRGDHTQKILETGNILASNGALHAALNKILN
ncbi:MAG: inositol monophosphatase [Alphaproteobacteria bacterium]